MCISIFGDQDPRIKPHKAYLWTNSIRDGRGILLNTQNREIIVKSLRRLVWEGKIKVYAFVIMPNHIHLVWEFLSLDCEDIIENFREETTRLIVNNMNVQCSDLVKYFKAGKGIRKYRIWRKKPKSMPLQSKSQISNALMYVHHNPSFDRWGLVKSETEFKWSSAGYYDSGIDPFGFLTHYLGSEDRIPGMA